MSFTQKVLLNTIRFYQKVISPLTPPQCKYLPTCSEYTRQCIENLPLHLAFFYSIKRIISCNPWAQGGYDPAPTKHSCKHPSV